MRKVMMIGVLVGVGGFLFAEGSQPRVEGSTADALLAEVRALRAEVTQVTSAGIRTQVLVARLQLQEQRVLNAARQLADFVPICQCDCRSPPAGDLDVE